MKNTVQITFDCPLKNQLTQEGDGNFDCAQCQKKVHNFTQMDRNSFEKSITDIESQNLCGMYRLDQISSTSKLNWKTRLNFKYEQWRMSGRLLLVPALILGFFIVVTGCKTRQVAGKIAPYHWKYGDLNVDSNNSQKPSKKH